MRVRNVIRAGVTSIFVGLGALLIAVGLDYESRLPEVAGPRDTTWLVYIAFAIIPLMVAAFVVSRARFRDPFRTYLRFERFAQRNGLLYHPIKSGRGYPGTLFHQSRGPILDSFTGRGNSFEMGNYRYSSFNRAFRQTIWGFLRLRTNRRLPNMVLHARRNKGPRELISTTIPTSQKLTLEGDFNSHFTLYVPRGYERDALYIFTPDLMALLIDDSGDFDIEIVDDSIVFYSPKPFDFTDQRTLTRLAGIDQVIGKKFDRQTARYEDERVSDSSAENTVAEPGRRLAAFYPYVIGGVGVILLAIIQQTLRIILTP